MMYVGCFIYHTLTQYVQRNEGWHIHTAVLKG